MTVSTLSGALFAAALFFVPTTPASASAVPVEATSTANWSGYGLAGSGFTGVTGTFTVPTPVSSPSCMAETAVWVGVDGLHNHDLLQAGIAETGFARATGTTPPYPQSGVVPGSVCLGQAQVYAWWEDLPSDAVRVGLPVKAGDTIKVSIFKTSPGRWAIAVHDLTANESVVLRQPYAGPQTSVEWVVEAPQVMGLNRDPVPFSAVHFSNLTAQGEAHDLERFSLRSGHDFSFIPDAVGSTAQLMRSGFAVHLSHGGSQRS